MHAYFTCTTTGSISRQPWTTLVLSRGCRRWMLWNMSYARWSLGITYLLHHLHVTIKIGGKFQIVNSGLYRKAPLFSKQDNTNQWFCYTPVWKTDVLCRGNVRPSVCPSVRLSVRPSVRVFRTFLQHALRNQFETWYIHSVGGTTCRVSVASQLGHFDLVYSQK